MVSFITLAVSAELHAIVSPDRAFPHDLWFSAGGWPATVSKSMLNHRFICNDGVLSAK